MFRHISFKFGFLAVLLATVGCRQTVYTTPVAERHLSVAEAGLASSYDIIIPAPGGASENEGDMVLGTMNLIQSTNRQIAIVYEITDPKFRKEAEKKGEPVIRSATGSLLKLDGKIYFEANESANIKGNPPAFSLNLIVSKGDGSGTIIIARLDLISVASDPLVQKVESADKSKVDTYLVDSSKLSSSQLLGKLSPDLLSAGVIELRVRKN